jgi:uncharacterized protein (TIGR00730 family)
MDRPPRPGAATICSALQEITLRVAIFTGSSLGPGAHVEAATTFAAELVAAGTSIVYGGGRVGLMGVVADAAMAAGGEVIGVIPGFLVDREVAHQGLSRLEVVATMHERKARMAELADAFVALPGGAGTLDELFEAWTWGQLGLHSKAVALFDADGFYRPLLDQLDAMAVAGYLDPAYLASVGRVGCAGDLLQFVAGYQRPATVGGRAGIPRLLGA